MQVYSIVRPSWIIRGWRSLGRSGGGGYRLKGGSEANWAYRHVGVSYNKLLAKMAGELKSQAGSCHPSREDMTSSGPACQGAVYGGTGSSAQAVPAQYFTIATWRADPELLRTHLKLGPIAGTWPTALRSADAFPGRP